MKLIIFDKSKNISYFGECKLQFNGPDKCLYLKMLDKDPEETITATFDRIFICKNNFLCCLDYSSDDSLILVFSTKEKCEHILNGVIKVKSRQSQTSENVAVNEEETFKESFYVPLVKAAKSVIHGFEELKSIILDFVNSLDFGDRFLCLNILAETLLVPTSFLNAENESADIPIPFESAFESSLTSSRTNARNSRMRKRSLRNISYKESDDEEKRSDEIQSKKLKKTSFNKVSPNYSNLSCFDEPTPKNVLNDVNFDIVQCLHDGNLMKKLLLFTSKDRKECYEFILIRSKNLFQCIKCKDSNKNIFIRSTIHNDGSKSFNFNGKKHFCAPIEYLPENYQSSFIVHSPNFEFSKCERHEKVYPLLIVFDSDDRSLFYEFGFDFSRKIYRCLKCNQYNNIKFIARFIQHGGKTAVELYRLK